MVEPINAAEFVRSLKTLLRDFDAELTTCTKDIERFHDMHNTTLARVTDLGKVKEACVRLLKMYEAPSTTTGPPSRMS